MILDILPTLLKFRSAPFPLEIAAYAAVPLVLVKTFGKINNFSAARKLSSQPMAVRRLSPIGASVG